MRANRRAFLQLLTAGLAVLGFSRTEAYQEYPAQWLDWYHRDGKMFPVDHSCGAEYEGGELVWMQELAGEEPILYRVPERPAPGTVVTHILWDGQRGSRYTTRYLGVMRG